MNLESILRYGLKRMIAAIGIIVGVSLFCFFIVECKPIESRILMRRGLWIGLSEFDFSQWYNETGFEMGFLEEDGTPIPALKRYLQWWGFMRNNKGVFQGLLQGKLGSSWYYNDKPIENVIGPNIWFSFLLSSCCFTLITMVGLFGGFIYFKKRDLNENSKNKNQRILVVPIFLLILYYVFLFSQLFGFNSINYDDVIIEPFLISREFYKYLLLPLLAFFIWSLPFTIRIIATNAEQILDKKYQKKLNDCGFSQKQKNRIIQKKMIIFLLQYFRNNLAIIYSVLAIIEIVFKLPGFGTLTLFFANRRDFSSLLASMIIYSFIITLHKFLLEITLACLDSRMLTNKQILNHATTDNRWIHHY